jgi:hypothetical protein
VLRQHDGALGHEAVNQRLLAAVHGAPPQKPLTETLGRNRRQQESAREFNRGEELYKPRIPIRSDLTGRERSDSEEDEKSGWFWKGRYL